MCERLLEGRWRFGQQRSGSPRHYRSSAPWGGLPADGPHARLCRTVRSPPLGYCKQRPAAAVRGAPSPRRPKKPAASRALLHNSSTTQQLKVCFVSQYGNQVPPPVPWQSGGPQRAPPPAPLPGPGQPPPHPPPAQSRPRRTTRSKLSSLWNARFRACTSAQQPAARRPDLEALQPLRYSAAVPSRPRSAAHSRFRRPPAPSGSDTPAGRPRHAAETAHRTTAPPQWRTPPAAPACARTST